jgi:hypothetical protein
MTNESNTPALDQVLGLAEQRIAALEARLARMERASAPEASPMEEVSSRRGLFKLAGAVATGTIASTFLSASPAAAAENSTLLLGTNNVPNNTATTETTLTRNATVDGAALSVIHNSSSAALGDAIVGESKGTAKGAGVVGKSDTGFGVYGTSASGYALFAGGSGRIGISPHITEGPPTSGSYATGDIVSGADGSLWTCTTAGTPGQWLRISERASTNTLPSGVTTLFKQAARDYVSLSAGPIVPGAPRTVRLSSLPRSAKGAIISATIVSPTAWVAAFPATGYVSIIAGGSTFFVPSVNFIPGTLQNTSLVVTAVDSQQQVIMATVGAGGCHIILDVLGYLS